MGALVIVVAVYVLVALAGVGAQPVEEFEDPEQQSAGLAVILENITGSSVPATILAAGAVISIFSVTLVTLYGQTRILFAMGRDGMLPKRFASVNPVTLTPTFNTIVVSIVVALIGGFVPADYLWDTVSIGTLMAFIVVATAVLVLRRTAPDLERPFKVPGLPGHPGAHDRGVPLHPVRPGRRHLGDLRVLAGRRARVLPAVGPTQRRAQQGRRGRHGDPRRRPLR